MTPFTNLTVVWRVPRILVFWELELLKPSVYLWIVIRSECPAFTFVKQRLLLREKRLPLHGTVYQPNRCLSRAQDFSILFTKTDEAVRLPLNSNTKWVYRVYLYIESVYLCMAPFTNLTVVCRMPRILVFWELKLLKPSVYFWIAIQNKYSAFTIVKQRLP